MRQLGLSQRAVVGGIFAGFLAYFVITLLDQLGVVDTRNVTESVVSLAFLGGFVGAFGFERGSQLWNDTQDAIDDAFPNS